MPVLPLTLSSLYSNHTDYVQPTLARVNRRVYHSDGDFTNSSGSGGNSDHAHGLSVGGIVGIAIGGLIALVLVTGLLFWWKPKYFKAGIGSKGKRKSQVGDSVRGITTQGNGPNAPQSLPESPHHQMADEFQGDPSSMENHVWVVKILNRRLMFVFDQRWRLSGIYSIPRETFLLN